MLPQLQELSRWIDSSLTDRNEPLSPHKIPVKLLWKQPKRPQVTRPTATSNSSTSRQPICSARNQVQRSTCDLFSPFASQVPREFFVVETSAIIPSDRYSQDDYQSRYNEQRSSWETIVFPALQPKTRQQVILLQETLDKMLMQNAGTALKCTVPDQIAHEYAIYKLCLHELIRQMHFQCRQQSKLLWTMYHRFDHFMEMLLIESKKQNEEIQSLERMLYNLTASEDQNLSKEIDVLEKRAEQIILQRGLDCHSACTACSCEDTGKEKVQTINAVDLEILMQKGIRQYVDIVVDPAVEVLVGHVIEEVSDDEDGVTAKTNLEIRQESAQLIQKVFRGYRIRRFLKHHRAVMQVIHQRRRRLAAAACIQTTFRCYLAKRRQRAVARESLREVTGIQPISDFISCIPALQKVRLFLRSYLDSTQVMDSQTESLMLLTEQAIRQAQSLTDNIVDLFSDKVEGTSFSQSMNITSHDTRLDKDCLHISTSTTDLMEISDDEFSTALVNPDMDHKSPQVFSSDEFLVTIDAPSPFLQYEINMALWEPSLHAIHQPDSPYFKVIEAYPHCKDALVVGMSRDNANKLLSLKQLIANTYCAFLGRMRKAFHFQESSQWISAAQLIVEWRCAISLSTEEWRCSRQSRMNASSPSHLDLAEIIQQNFRCQYGLECMVENAWKQLFLTLKQFRYVDPDVNCFYYFLANRSSTDDLFFYCICRQIACSGSRIKASEVPQSQFTLHPKIFREMITIEQAEQVARVLFRIDDEANIRTLDQVHVDVDSKIYSSYLPSNGLSSFMKIVKKSLPRAYPKEKKETFRTSHLRKGNADISKSEGPQSPRVEDARDTDWVYWDDIIRLLSIYRAEVCNLQSLLDHSVQLYLACNEVMGMKQFIEALHPYFASMSEREIGNLFRNIMHREKLKKSFELDDEHESKRMTLRVFVSTVLELVENKTLQIPRKDC